MLDTIKLNESDTVCDERWKVCELVGCGRRLMLTEKTLYDVERKQVME